LDVILILLVGFYSLISFYTLLFTINLPLFVCFVCCLCSCHDRMTCVLYESRW